MGSLVIVALPEEDDRVHKISSEKAPHLTLLYLGDVDEVSNVDQIVQFVEHAVTLSEHGQFYLDVDHRGELGEEKADVLFFNKKSYNLKWIKQFRGQLLQNDAVRTAYDTADQFGAPQEWTPHLTLGYPETPANDPSSDDAFGSRLYSVCFDRIAVWVGDSEGPEFRLEWPDREYEGDLAIAYSDTFKSALTHYANHPVEGALEHHGVKGMKWGVRKSSLRETNKGLRTERKQARKDQRGKGKTVRQANKDARLQVRAARTERNKARLDSAKVNVKLGAQKTGRGIKKALAALDEHFYETSIYSIPRQERVHNKVADDIDRKIYQLQSAPKYRGKNLKTDHALKTEYEQDVAKVAHASYKRAVKAEFGDNTKGTKEARYVDDARGARIEIRDKKTGDLRREADLRSVQQIQADKLEESLAQAATEPEAAPDITISVKLDANGQIKAVGRVKESTAEHGEVFVDGLLHGATSLDKEFILAHYGVKGMRWGQRKAPEAVTPSATSVVPAGNKRKTKVKAEGGENHPASGDALKVAEASAKLKKSGPKALTNQELREVAERTRLEAQAVEAVRPSTSKYIRKLLGQQGNQLVNEVIREGVREGRTQTSERLRPQTA